MTASTPNLQRERFGNSIGRTPRPQVARFDCWKTDTTFALSGEFPGIQSDQFRVEFNDKVLAMRGAAEIGDGSGRTVKSELPRSSFARSFHIPEEINGDGIKAIYANAALAVVLAIVQLIAPRQISVSSC